MSSCSYIGKFSTFRMLSTIVSSLMRGFFLLFVITRLPVLFVFKKTRFLWQRLFYHTPKYFFVLVFFLFYPKQNYLHKIH